MNMLALDVESMRGSFPAEPFPIRHRLSDHPLLQLRALADLAVQLPRDRVEYNSGRLKPNQSPDQTPAINLAPADVISQIETAGAWMVLKNVEAVPEYRQLIEACLEEAGRAAQVAGPKDLGMQDFQGFIFVSSANAITPFHLDYEENFFVHLHGEKFMHVFDNRDRSLVSEAELETFPGKHRNLTYKDTFERRAKVFRFEAGEGMFLPYTWPHWVRNGNDWSISMAITWKSSRDLRQNQLYFANAMLRRMRLPQPRPGRYPMLDSAKIAAFALVRAAINPLRRGERARRRLRAIFFGKAANYFYGQKPS